MILVDQRSPETVTHVLALAVTGAIAAYLVAAAPRPSFKPPLAEPMQILLESEHPDPAPATPVVPTPPPPTPIKPVRPVVRRDSVQPVAAPVIVAADLSAALASEPENPASSTVQAPVPRTSPSANLESQYAAMLRTNIDSRTTLPTSIEYRLTRPRGEVRVNFTLVRSGGLVSAELGRSSGSPLLDRHALEIVRTGQYPAFPNEAFQGETRHSFLVTLEFHS